MHTFYFLSHFHSDHYTGITNRWQHHTIYCSRPTAALIQSRIGVPASCLFPMDLRQTYIFSLTTGMCLHRVCETPHHPRVDALLNPPAKSSEWGPHAEEGDAMFAVRPIMANHCPGAVMFLFVSPTFGTVLHSGDFRFNGSQKNWQKQALSSYESGAYVRPSLSLIQRGKHQYASARAMEELVAPPSPFYEQFIADDEALQEVAQRQLLDVLFLDNTFCAPAYRFPSQWKATQTVISVLRSLFHRAACSASGPAPSRDHPPRRQVRCAVLIGCYTIGKERIALALREAFPLVRGASVKSHSRDSSVGSQRDVNAHDVASWRIHVSPSRYALLSSMQFFEECFEPLQASSVNEKAVTSSSMDGDTCSRSLAGTADVEDVPVLLPVEFRACNTQTVKRESGARDVTLQSVQTDASPASPTPSSLAADIDTLNGERGSSAIAGEAGEVENLLSVFLVPMAKVGYRSVVSLARANGPATVDIEDGLSLNLSRYDQVLVVEPSGWCKRTKTWNVSGKFTLLCVPYSEHCAFEELLQFVEFVNPARVVPTVSKESFKKHETLFVERTPRLRSRLSNAQPITKFFTAHPLHKEDTPKRNAEEDAGHVGGAAHVPAVGHKRTRTECDGATVSAPTSRSMTASIVSTTACTLKQLFQKLKGNSTHRSPAAHRLGVAVDEDEDCQVVRVLQKVVEISDDD
ncbi:hypothetical protein JKF63_01892 [Porcisia hertigi]|uniref:Protein artemis n=1 Tax=Porcisia hertigi TaxID=2761500 RepID=A0A836I5S7_9TRYP|nr:hypothetical protein JKF63_01892 [Porcisia hertigi]